MNLKRLLKVKPPLIGVSERPFLAFREAWVINNTRITLLKTATLFSLIVYHR